MYLTQLKAIFHENKDSIAICYVANAHLFFMQKKYRPAP